MSVLIVCGSRSTHPKHKDRVFQIIDQYTSEIDSLEKVISGGCRGVDLMAKEWSTSRNVRFQTFWANWDDLGRAAGPARNRTMAGHGTHCLAIVDGPTITKGTANMVSEAMLKGLQWKIVHL